MKADGIHDLIIIGAGPSALAAAIYTSREDISTTLYEKAVVGGIPAIIDKIDNYPGFPDGIEGTVLAEQMEKQAKRFGAQVELGEVLSIGVDGDVKKLDIDGSLVQTKTVLIATGRGYGKIGAPGESEYFGRGVHYCATCDGAFYNNKKLAVIGGANSAIQEAIYLTRFASHIDLIVRSTIKASAILQKNLQKFIEDGKVTIHLGTTIDEIIGKDGHVTSIKVTENKKPVEIEVDGIFVFVGMKPNTEFLKKSSIKLDENGFILTDNTLQTNMLGVFASGDVRSGATMQIASAVGEGVTAAISIREYLHDLGK